MFLVKHAVGDIALVAQVALTVVQGDMDGVVVAHMAREVSAQGDLWVAGGNGSAELHFQLGGNACNLQLAREHPVGDFVDERADDAAVQRLDPAVIVDIRGPGGDDVLAVFPEFQMKADGIRRAAAEAILALLIQIWINQLFHYCFAVKNLSALAA